MEWGAIAIGLAAVPTWVWVSLAVTAIHTLDESCFGEVSIWASLSIPAWLYFAFQLFVAALPLLALTLSDAWLVLLIVIRLGDALITHLWLAQPGRATALLLVVDAVILGGEFK